jgi:methionyl-tRNA formyltransferase
MGTPSFALAPLQQILNSKHEVTAVVTASDKPGGRGLKVSESVVKKFALKNNLKILQPGKLNDPAFAGAIRELNPDLIVVVAFKILPKEVFTIPRFGSVNLHASLLPKYRGAAPINWAIINGESKTGVTTFFLKEKVDTGNIIMQQPCDISVDDNAGTLHDKLSELGADVLISTINKIEMTNGNVQVYLQDNKSATNAPKITPELCHIDWNKNSVEIHNLIRGLSPYPAAFSIMNNKRIKILKSKIEKEIYFENEIPGVVKRINNKLFVKTGDSSLEITEIQMEGKKRLTTTDFLKGYTIKPNLQFC